MAFNLYFKKLEKVELTDEDYFSVGEIELVNGYSSYHFQGCENLTKVHFKGDADITIPSNAFRDCSNLDEITFGNEDNNINKEQNYNLKIGDSAFVNTKIEKFETKTKRQVNFLAWPFNIEEKEEEEITLLKSFLIPNAEKFIGVLYLKSLNNLTLNEKIKVDQQSNNNGYDITIISNNSNDSEIEVDAGFYQKIKFQDGSTNTIKSLVITNYTSDREEIKSYSVGAPDSATWNKLQTLKFGPNLIIQNGFSGLSDLSTLSIGENITFTSSSITNIGKELTELNIPNTTFFTPKSTASYFSFNIRETNDKPLKITASLPSTFLSLNNYFGTLPCNTTLVISEIQNGDNIIQNNFATGQANLVSITLPEGIETIGDNAFSGCSSLKSIWNFEWVKTIGNSAFSGCTNLNNLNLSQVKTFGSSAFDGCNSLSGFKDKLDLSNATEIGSYAFQNCRKINTIILPRNSVDIGELAFEGCNSNDEDDTADDNSTIKLILSKNVNPSENVEINCFNFESTNTSPTEKYIIYYRGSEVEYQGNILNKMEENQDYLYFNPEADNVTVYYYSENQPASSASGQYWCEIGGGVKIYFSLSAFNKPEDIKNILYTIADPNHGIVKETNSMMTSQFAPAGYLSAAFDVNTLNENGEYYFEVELGNRELFKSFSTGQYYQIQIYLTDIESIPNIITTQWLNDNKDRISLGSQISLIRPVEPPLISIEGDGEEEGYEINKIKGNLINENAIKEPLASCYCEFYTYDENKKEWVRVYKSDTVKNTILDGFEIPIDFDTPGTYIIKTHFTTINGYSNFVESPFELKPYINGNSISVDLLPDIGGIKIEFSSDSPIYQKIQRKDASGRWKTIWSSTNENSNSGSWWLDGFYDYSTEAGSQYEYRAIRKSGENMIADYTGLTDTVELDDIVLCDKNELVILKYNPVISNFKYVTQDNILGTLGGKYPVIRRNGDMNYRQFTLTGTIFIDKLYNANDLYLKPMDSLVPNNTYEGWDGWRQELGSLITFNDDRALEDLDQKEFEKRARLRVMDFLTNGQPKLFKSYEEGNMIVYLSNISFTPNKTLSRHIYDFSATVTEFCEVTQDNINKYIK